ncbi:hypothetical protein [uncultured Corynebacterium sp.]|uniref:hypothetical protein n=1 Tax=uncultured Corynebacterium sp. TaxID=159447 RepID=UPI0025D8C60C|nr:hypothetical protein [uncultured Corynebacterium sp.]
MPTSNFGGFILGTALALIGGALALSWSPDERPDGKPRGAKKKARSRGAKKKSRKPGAKAEAGSGVADTGAAPAATGTGAAPVATGTGNGTGNDTGAGPGIARRIPRPDDAGDELSADVAVPARSTGSTGSTGTGGAAGAASLVAVIALVGLLAGPALTPMSASTPRAQAAPAAPAVPQIPGLPGVEGLPLLPGPGLPEVEGLPSPSELLPAPPSPEDEGAGSSGGIGLGAPPEPQAGELAISDSMEVITADSVRLLGNVRLSQTEVTLTNGEVEQAIRFDADRVELDNLALQAANVEVGLTTAPGSMSTLTGNFHIVVRALTVTPAASVGELIPITIDARWIDDEALKALASNSLGLPDAITDELILNDASLDSYIVRSDQLELPPTARIS